MYNGLATVTAETPRSDHRLGEVTCAFFFGAAVGAGLGLLLAPAAGRETREELTARARRGRDEAKGVVSEAVERGRTAVEQARTHASRVAAEGRETLAELRARKEHAMGTLGHEAAAAVADVKAALRGARKDNATV